MEMSRWVSPLFVVKNWKFCLVFFFSKIGENSVFCNLVYEKEAILDYKNTHFKKSKFCIFPSGLIYGFWSKIGNFMLFCFST